ncbi:hypothetical protein [Saccharospirillum impatiens]|jgi:hypothetical protein|uniref:hypothetical protein n=1 Tax=Saccharospirillum impatiens TaxID=169438 RepID=UPI0012F94BD1|nr:hypothetical protein [Saccharospirillum impatiens]
MTEINIFKKWEPILGLQNAMYVEGLYDDYEGFRILLKGSGECAKMLRIKFDPPLAYRAIDEGDLLAYERVNSYSNSGQWTLFVVENSSYLSWFQHTSQGIHNERAIVHYAIFTSSSCIEVLAEYEPSVDWLN